MNDVNQEERAFRAWDVLVECASTRSKITYGKVASRLGIHHRPVRYFLELIQNYCLQERLPPLSILVVDQRGRPGRGFIAWDVANLDEGFEKVFAHNWRNEENPFQYAKGGDTIDHIAAELVSARSEPSDVYARVKVRGVAQLIFRTALLKAYGSRCAICGFPYEIGLDAAHIKPWSKCTSAERLDVSNGLLLCRNHHALFDAGVLHIGEDVSVDMPSWNSTLAGGNAKTIRPPLNPAHRPDPVYLRYRLDSRQR
jgi:putative restriction endonuclease